MKAKLRFACCVMMLLVMSWPAGCLAGYDRGLVNEPLDHGPSFFDRYDYNEYIPLGGLSDENCAEGWSYANYLAEAGGKDYTVVNCSAYVNASAEANDDSRTLQKFYLGSKVRVLGFWRDWALCVCDNYSEQNCVCGWVNEKYLAPFDENAGRDDNGGASESEKASAVADTGTEIKKVTVQPARAVTERDTGESEAAYAVEEDPSDYADDPGKYIGEQYIVNCDEWVSLRQEPNTSSTRLAKVPRGATVQNCYDLGNGFYLCNYNGTQGYILRNYLSSNPPPPKKTSSSSNSSSDDGRYDLSQYEYRPVAERGRGSLVFQKSPRGSSMKNHKFHDGDYVYVNVNWRKSGYGIAYDKGEYGYVDASYIDW